jgi:hypothetical protein
MPGKRILQFWRILQFPIRQKKMKYWRILQFLKLKYLLDPNAVFDTSIFLETEVFTEYFKITLKP